MVRLTALVLAMVLCGCGGFPLGDAPIDRIKASVVVTGAGTPGELRVQAEFRHVARKGAYDVSLDNGDFLDLDGVRLEAEPDFASTRYVATVPSWKADTFLVLHRANGEHHAIPLRRCEAFTLAATTTDEAIELQLSSGADPDLLRVAATSDTCKVTPYSRLITSTDGRLTIPLDVLRTDDGQVLAGCTVKIFVTKARFEEAKTEFAHAFADYDVGARTELTLPAVKSPGARLP